jgi:hypothetical protein
MEEIRPFEFMECVSILKSTGKRARNIRELRMMIADISDESLSHHTYQYFLKGHALEYTNDFAHWIGESLEERALSERLSNIDPFVFTAIGLLRDEILSSIDDYIAHFPEPREALFGDEFYFNETVPLVFPVGIRAKNLAEFLIAVKYIDSSSIYYHFYEARIRHGRDDFSTWIEEVIEKPGLARAIQAIDPFMHPIEGIKAHIVEAVESAVRQDMEVIADD